MSSRYRIYTEPISSEEVPDHITPYVLGEKDRLERLSKISRQSDILD